MKKLIFLVILLSSCQKNYYENKGYFSEYKSLKNDKLFVTNRLREINSLVKITDDRLGYYCWKTLKYNFGDSSEVFSMYKTVLNDELKKFNNYEKYYIYKENNLLINYLIFIDNYRCLYISHDDIRSRDFEQNIALYFNYDTYKIPRKKRKFYKQILRGYYSLDNNSLFIHFEKESDFYIDATIVDNKITFNSITNPNSTSKIFNDGFNPIQYKYVDSIKMKPVFEIPDTILLPNEINLTFGFEFSKLGHLPMHKQILNDNPGRESEIFYITSIKYNFDIKDNYFREYYYYAQQDSTRTIFSVRENISVTERNDGIANNIQTW